MHGKTCIGATEAMVSMVLHIPVLLLVLQHTLASNIQEITFETYLARFNKVSRLIYPYRCLVEVLIPKVRSPNESERERDMTNSAKRALRGGPQ